MDVVKKLQSIPDQKLQDSLYVMTQTASQMAQYMHSLPDVNDVTSYEHKRIDYEIVSYRLNHLLKLTDYMDYHDKNKLIVLKETLLNIKKDLLKAYMYKINASDFLNNNHSKLMMEVRWMLLNKPFNP